jgi:preprotein translocase subunit SecE
VARSSEQPKRNVFQRILRFLKEVRAELRKVAWPNRKELTSYTIVVLVAVAIVAVYVGVIDYLVSVILGLVI